VLTISDKVVLKVYQLFEVNYWSRKQVSFARFKDFEAMKIQVTSFWAITLCSDVVGYQRFGGPFYCLRNICK